jgi:CTP:molybdopterin cytidylyltransferase MocA
MATNGSHILLLAAGASRRMRGRDKLLEPLGARPLLRERAETCLATGLPVTVVLPPGAPARRRALDGLAVTLAEAADAAEGMGRSLAAGVAALPGDASAVLVVLADMPELTSADLDRVADRVAEDPQAIWRAQDATGAWGHPVLFPAALFDDLRAIGGDEGARAVLAAHAGRLRAVALQGRRATTDLDTPEDWAAWRRRHAL